MSVSCSKNSKVNPLDPASSCINFSENYYNNFINYSNNPTKENCQVLLKTLKDYVDKCNLITADEKKEYNKQISETTCE